MKFLDNSTIYPFINGKFEDIGGLSKIAVVNPADETDINQIYNCNAETVDYAVQTAKNALENGAWPKLLPNQREKVLLRYADIIEKHENEIARLLVSEHGKLLVDARKEVSSAVECFRYYAGWATKIMGNTLDVSLAGAQHFAYTKREPIGVVGAIAPWNVPVMMFAWKIAPALACGCTVVFKPSEVTPLTALFMANLSLEIGLPAGVLNVITGTGDVTGDAMVKHPKIAKITFTGSTQVGKIIGKNAMDTLKNTTLELGGKNPVLVLDDADFSKVPAGVSKGIFYNQGQVCVSGSRLYLPKSHFENTLADMANITQKMVVGNGLDAASQMGPVVSQEHFNKVMKYIDLGQEDGLEVVSGAKRLGEKGYFVAPTIFANTDNKPVPTATEEIFGPVIVAMPYDNLDDLIRLANDTPYGLSASVWTQNISKAHQVIDALKAGMIYVNSAVRSDPNLPLGGYKQSGIGRELGYSAIEAYTELKSVCIAY